MITPYATELATVLAGMGVGQSLLFAVLLWLRRERPANVWLALCHLAIAQVMALLLFNNVWKQHLDGRLTAHMMLNLFFIGPLLWGYARALTGRPLSMCSPWLWCHLLPGLLLHLGTLAGWITIDPPPADESAWSAENYTPGSDASEIPSLLLVGIHIGSYCLAVWLLLRRHQQTLKTQFSRLGVRSLQWLSTLSLALAAAIALWFGLRWLAPMLADLIVAGAYLVLAGVAGLRGLHQPAAMVQPEPEAGPEANGAKYAKSVLDATQAETIRQALLQLMARDKPYLEEDLTLSGLAGQLRISPHHLSQVLNGAMATNFFDYINRHRVEAVQRCLVDPAYAEQTVLDIGLACGFSAKTTFNTVFKRLTGVTPTAYRQQARAAAPPHPDQAGLTG
ncbi:helix-turn-helix transcriptional regulator [Chitiniphilus purpureus]|uniref:Helix-turn-helix transcriptional regulator n=1 Tax=Chitiniphilus purpureus TaxID=2981137 RepID=A0ABY6DPA2_9NEIS|nr:helix-turn-helix transcriptional regulator [Chitiniphilus sp. CD1]UXY15311.1 helix-turn-helix transcriptional regulator [Chitiniphilus sp. CD1]